MLKRPRFKPHFRVQLVPGEGVFVLSDTSQTLLRGQLYEQVVPRLTGCLADEVCDGLGDQLSPAEVYFVLEQLQRKGYLCDQEDALPPGEAAFWSAQQLDPVAAAQRLAETPLRVQAFGVAATALVELLRAFRIPVAEDAEQALVLVDDYLREELEVVNREALRTGRPWLLARPVGREVWVGPLFRPGVTGCWECLAQRLRANSPVRAYLDDRAGHHALNPVQASTPASLQIALGLTAQAAANWLAGSELHRLEATLQTLDVASWQLRAHVLIRLPFCPACGSREPAEVHTVQPVVLKPCPKSFTEDGGHRAVPPEVTLARYGHHVSPITGAVTGLDRVGPADESAMHVYVAGQNLAQKHRSLDHLRGNLRSMSAGKGVGDLQARASGLCEGLERYSGVFRGDEPRRRATLRSLGDSAIHPNECMRFSDRQYRERNAWNARESAFTFVPLPFDPSAEVDWTPLWSLTRREARYLPTALCYFDYPYPNGRQYAVGCSNGNAAGNTLEEAILQGFLELVERDAVALWWYNRVRRPGVNLEGFGDAYPAQLRAALRARGREIWALDLTADLGIPVFAALCRQTSGAGERIILGFGAHLEARVALLRALTEMNQILSASLRVAPGQEDLLERSTDGEVARWLRSATVANQPYLAPDPACTPRDASCFQRAWSGDVTDDVRACQALVERQGLEMLVLDQTRPEIGLPVARVVVPGLRHFWARLAPGRLYDVPVRLGWLARPLAEEELNPIPMFL